LTEKKNKEEGKRGGGGKQREQNSFSDRQAGVNDLAAYCTPVERVDSGYANLAHGPTKPSLLSLPSFPPPLKGNPFSSALVAFIVH